MSAAAFWTSVVIVLVVALILLPALLDWWAHR
jgi:hypothetical protein